MNANHKQAAKLSQAGQTQFVVYVPDEGERVYNAEQLKVWQAFVFVEAAYLDGKQISAPVAA